ncbi:uncharacterized protein B0I36DRAFT_18326 [Microdochium trichocladiopsis]|uniref:Secreted protein n=1 Tax=Microdochium trichocladiopsis TaxID=1682393 RepID=A0A9P9BW56_9PEZI|nr:uncharacterized protein B0I36DRAFT_18326 [Microdochium trichocladiopsis]KAH7041023.1 hypothetical protein B0I36DRAFT_18326 [Microdochium trichocladiopsis]
MYSFFFFFFHFRAVLCFEPTRSRERSTARETYGGGEVVVVEKQPGCQEIIVILNIPSRGNGTAVSVLSCDNCCLPQLKASGGTRRRRRRRLEGGSHYYHQLLHNQRFWSATCDDDV